MSLGKMTTAFAMVEKGDRIHQKRKKVTRIALTEFPYKNTANDLTRNVYETLSTCFIRKGLQVVERSQLDRVFQEQKISYSGMIDISTAQKLGQMLGTEAVLLGSVTDSGNNVVVRARLVDVGNGVAMTAAEVEITKNPEIQSLLRASTGGQGQSTSGDVPISFTKEGSEPQGKELLFSGQPKTTEHFTIKLHSKEIGEGGELRLNFLITTKSNVNFYTRMEQIYLGDDMGNIYPALKSSNTQMDCVAGVPRRFALGFDKYPQTPMNLVLDVDAGKRHLLTARFDLKSMTVEWK